MFAECRRGGFGEIAKGNAPAIKFHEPIEADVLIQKMTVISRPGAGDPGRRQIIENSRPLRSALPAVIGESFIHLDGGKTNLSQSLGVIRGLQREDFLGLLLAVLDVYGDGCAVVIDRATAGQSGVSSHGFKPFYCNTSW